MSKIQNGGLDQYPLILWMRVWTGGGRSVVQVWLATEVLVGVESLWNAKSMNRSS